jgi:hypothetical protein
MSYHGELFRQRREAIVSVMKAGGYWSTIMDSGPDLSRVKEFLLRLSGEVSYAGGTALHNPRFLPLFPGLTHKPVHTIDDFPWVRVLENAYPVIRREIDALEQSPQYFDYDADIRSGGAWLTHPFYFMGVRAQMFCDALPKTMAILDALPNLAWDYPWADALISALEPGTHLIPHCSVDNLRLRCHLGIKIPSGVSLRVGEQELFWQEGKVILFEDSFEHEVWHRGNERRLVLIVDFWHPDLTPLERHALMAGFRKAEIRQLLFDLRLDKSLSAFCEILRAEFVQQEAEAWIQSYWPRKH